MLSKLYASPRLTGRQLVESHGPLRPTAAAARAKPHRSRRHSSCSSRSLVRSQASGGALADGPAGLDGRQARIQDLRKMLVAELGERRAMKFSDAHVGVLVDDGYEDAEDFQIAAKVNALQSLALPPARLSNLVARFQAPPAGEPSAPVVPVQRRQIVQDQQDPNVLLLHDAITHEPVKHQFVINPMVKLLGRAMRVDEVLKQYAIQVQQKFENGESQIPLLVSGPIKSGKSYTAEELLPAVVHSTFQFDYSSAVDTTSSLTTSATIATSFPTAPTLSSPTTSATTATSSPTTSPTTATSPSGSVVAGTARKPPAPIFLHVSCLDITRTGGTAGFFRGLLHKLKFAARQQGLAAATTPNADDSSSEGGLEALMDFYDRLPRDRITYVTFDEAQSFFLLQQVLVEQQRQKLLWDEAEIQQMRRSFKDLVLTAPCHVATVVTGSTMARVWANFAQTPTNGLALLTHNFPLHLPGYADADLMRSTWQCLQHRYQQLPAALRTQSLASHVLLIWLVKGWEQSGRGKTYVLESYLSMLYYKILADLKVVAETLGASDPAGTRSFGKTLLNLLDRNVGCNQRALLRSGMLAFLGDELQAAAVPGHVWVQSTVYKNMLQLVLSKTGELDGFLEEPSIGDWARLMTLQSLGEACASAR